jgi:hypothetical protein
MLKKEIKVGQKEILDSLLINKKENLILISG